MFPSQPPAYFSNGERLPAIWHTHLRLGQCHLNQHKFKCGQADTELCSCGMVEDVAHFLLECPKYAAHRVALLVSIANLISPGVRYTLLLHIDKKHILNIMLNGSSDLSLEENTQIFHFVQTFLKQSNRFESLFRF